MFRWFIIFIETFLLIYLIWKFPQVEAFLQRLLHAIPSSEELKNWILKGVWFGGYFATSLFLIAIFVTILRYLIPFIGTYLDKEALIEEWEKEFIKAKRAEINEIERLKQEAQKKLQEVQKQQQELRQQITHYQHLSHQLKRKEVELEIEFQQKRESYLQELSGLQRKNKELQARIKRLKEQLKSCREKLRRNLGGKNWVGKE